MQERYESELFKVKKETGINNAIDEMRVRSD